MQTPQNRIRAYLQAGGSQMLLLVGLCALSGLTWAAGGSDAAQAEMKAVLDTSGMAGDPSVKWLEMIFGSWILKLAGGGGSGTTIITVVAGFSNILALTFAMIASIYVLIAGAVRTAHEGEIMGKSWSTVWLPVRSAIGLGLLMPTSIGGGFVSVTQAAIMWCALVGANAANIVWTKSVGMLASGTPVSTVAPDNVYSYSRTVFLIHVCNESLKRGLDNGAPMERQNGDTIIYGPDGVCGEIQLPVASSTSPSAGRSVSAIGSGSGLSADQLDFGAAMSLKASVLARQIGIRHNAAMQKLAASYIENIGGEGLMDALASRQGENYNSAMQIVAEAESSIQKLSADVQGAKASAFSGSYSAKFAQALNKGGWSSAGLWTFNLARIQDTVSQPFQLLLSGATSGGAITRECESAKTLLDPTTWFDGGCPTKDITADMQGANRLFDMMVGRAGRDSKVGASDINLIASMKDGGTGAFSTFSAWLAFKVLQAANGFGAGERGDLGVGTQISGSGSISSDLGMADPFVTATNVGNAMRFAGTVATGAAIAGEGMLNVVGGNAASDATGFGDGLIAMGSRVVSIIIAVAMGLGVAGYVLSYAIPFMPTSIWIMQLVGWLLTVIEAFIAAPLAVAQMLLPEGEGIMGTRMERVLALLAAMTLRPSLMLMGLFAALAVARVGFSIYNQFFWATAGSMVTFDLMAVCSIIALYTMGLVVLCKFCLSIMYRLPNEVLNWFSSGTGGAFGEQEATAGAEQSVSQGGGMGGKMLESAQKANTSVTQRRREAAQHQGMVGAMKGRGRAPEEEA